MKRRERGITLVALVITIIIIIILSTVTINAAFGNNGLITKAQEARNLTVNSIAYEEESIANLIASFEKIIIGGGSTSNKWHYDADGNVTDGTVTLKIGDYVNYNCGTSGNYTSLEESNGYGVQTFETSSYTYGWRVLGVDEDTGEILLISEEIVGPTSGGYTDEDNNRTYYYLKGKEGYANGISELNNISAIYGNGYGATGARSITVEDINKITGYNPNNVGVSDPKQTGSGTKYGKGELYEYGNQVTYYWSESSYWGGYRLSYSATNGKSGTNYYSFVFWWYDSASGWQSLETESEQQITLESNYYYYYPNTLTTSSSEGGEGISTTSAAYKMLFTNSSTGAYKDESGLTDGVYYWLGSSCVCTAEFTYWYYYSYYSCAFGLRDVNDGYVGGDYLYYSYDISNQCYNGVRPVVFLKSDISLTEYRNT